MTQPTATPIPPPVEKPFVFISYKSEERAFVQRLADDLENNGVRVWWDRKRDQGIALGKRWQDEIDYALKHVEAFILVITPLAVASEMVRAELASAYSLIPEKIVPIMVRPVAVADLPFEVRTRHYLSFENAGQYDLHPKELIEALHKIITGTVQPTRTITPPAYCKVTYLGAAAISDAKPVRVEFFKDRVEKLKLLGVEINPSTDNGRPKRLIALIGRSGFGKSTALLKIISALYECRAPGDLGATMQVDVIHHRLSGVITLDNLKDAVADLLEAAAADRLRAAWMGADEARQIDLLVSALGQRRVMLTIDHIEMMLDESFDALDEIGHYSTLIALHEEVGALSEPIDEARRLRGLAVILHNYGRQKEAIAYARQTAEAANAIADPRAAA